MWEGMRGERRYQQRTGSRRPVAGGQSLRLRCQQRPIRTSLGRERTRHRNGYRIRTWDTAQRVGKDFLSNSVSHRKRLPEGGLIPRRVTPRIRWRKCEELARNSDARNRSGRVVERIHDLLGKSGVFERLLGVDYTPAMRDLVSEIA
jgi:hypothetical protein